VVWFGRVSVWLYSNRYGNPANFGGVCGCSQMLRNLA
jgi:hypothetical protein